MMNNNLLSAFTIVLLLLATPAEARAQETIDRIEISRWQMVGWTVNKPKLSVCYVIENGQLYEQKRNRLVLIGPCDTLAALLSREKIDAIFRGDENACESGYEVNIRYTYFTVDRNVRTQYLYEYSVQTHCRNEADERYLRSVQAELQKLIEAKH